MITTIITTVLGALAVAGVFALIKSRWLYVIAPKLYLNTPISDGQIVSLTVFNAGLLAEDDVVISLRPACKFELIATSKSSLTIKDKIISIPKLSRLETVTVLLLVEGKAFDQSDIDSVESKQTVGRIVEKKEQAAAAWQQVIVVPVLLVTLSLPFLFGTVIGADMKMSMFKYVSEQWEMIGPSKQLAGYKNTYRQSSGSGVLTAAVEKSLVVVQIQEIVRRGETLSFAVELKNNLDVPVMAEGYLKSSAGERGSVDYWDTRSESLAIAPKDSVLIKLKTYLPERISVKMVEMSFNFQVADGDSITASQFLEFN